MFDTNSISLERKIFDNLLSNIRGLNKEDSESLYYSIINREEYLENLIANYKTISIFDQLDINYFHKIKDLLLFQIEKFQIEKETLIEENSLLEVKEATKEIHLQKIIQRVEQKISYLNEFKKNVKVLFFENFKTLINVDGTKENTLNIDTKSGVATLPLKERKKANIKVFRILNESNGVPGNVIDGSGRLISALLEETDSYFQYTKLHEGPLKLVIEVTLKKKK